MKKTLLALIAGITAFMANAATPAIEFSYPEVITDYFGYAKSQQDYDVAMFLPGDRFEGYTITKIEVPVFNYEGIDGYANPTVWLSTDLKLEGGRNVPSIGSYEATVTNTKDFGILGGEVTDGYTITADGVYVGYSFSTSVFNMSTKYPLAFGETTYAKSFYLHTSINLPSWSNVRDMSGMGGYGSCITVTLEKDDIVPATVKLKSVNGEIYGILDEEINVDFALTFTGYETLTSIDVDMEIEGNVVTAHHDFDSSVGAIMDRSVFARVKFPAQKSLLSEDVKFSVSKVNGNANPDAAIALNSHLCVVKEAPVRQTLVEEYTGVWCGYCPRGYAALEYMRKNNPDFVLAAFHSEGLGNPDPMQITSSFPTPGLDFPSVVLNRRYTGDPYYGLQKFDTALPIVDDIIYLNSEFTPWNISVSHTWTSENELTANVEVSNVIGYSNKSFRIVYLLVADGLQGGKEWIQKNYYNTDTPIYIDELNDFCRGGIYGRASVANLVFNDVVVSAQGIKGVTNSVPRTLAADEKATHSLTFDLSKIDSDLIPDRNKLRIIAAVIDGSGCVQNCAKNEVNDYVDAAVDGVSSDENAPVEYYDLNGIRVTDPTKGLYIRRQGDKTSKVIIK